MKEYVVALIGASLLSGVVGMICPKRHEKYLRLLCGFCILSLLVAPLPSYLESVEDYLPTALDEMGKEENEIYEEIYKDTFYAANKEALEDSIKALIIQEFSLNKGEVSVAVLLAQEEDSVSLKNATVSLSGYATLQDPRAIAARVEALLGCPCEIRYGT